MALIGTAPCAKAGPMTMHTITGSIATPKQEPCIPIAGLTSTAHGTAFGQTVRCVVAGFGTQHTTVGSTALQKMVTCATTAGEELINACVTSIGLVFG